MVRRPSSTHTGATPDMAGEHAKKFGLLIRTRREALKMRQDDLALATGVGRRFIIDLENGKPSCHLGKALLVAAGLGLRPFELAADSAAVDDALLPDLPEDTGAKPRG